MSSEEEEVFSRKPLIKRSPTRTKIVTRSASNKSKSIEEAGTSAHQQESKQIDQTTKRDTQQTASKGNQTKATTRNSETETTQTIVGNLTNTGTQTTMANMNQKEIQQQITAFVPEFSGTRTTNRIDELTRFLGTADTIYETLTTKVEKDIFAKLIKFRLTGEAYSRITRRTTETYESFKEVLNNMYRQMVSLEELENKCTCIKQNYQESVKDYGHRLLEALDEYSSSYRERYGLETMDATYKQHLNSSAVLTFKKGLRNTILKEKISTSKAKTVEEIIDEAELVERMLLNTASISTQARTDQQEQRSQIICNYCHKINHTWNECRARLNAERGARRNTQYQQNAYQTNNKYLQNRAQYPSRPPYQMQKQVRFYEPPQLNNIRNVNNPQHVYNVPRLPQIDQNFRNNNTNGNRYLLTQNIDYTMNRRGLTEKPKKYCSYCKTTVGHTYEECRSKFRNNPVQQNHYTGQQMQNLEKDFKNMRINSITTRPPDSAFDDRTQETHQYQGNASGSNQI